MVDCVSLERECWVLQYFADAEVQKKIARVTQLNVDGIPQCELQSDSNPVQQQDFARPMPSNLYNPRLTEA
ncbi:hypothetical protein IAQ61_009936 [Plenodomus lingam]|nr:hypothetical protein IAQ61_009936 [Plenodomus lingam]